MKAAIRDHRPEDLGRVLQLWDQAGSVPDGADGITVDQACMPATEEGTLRS